MHPGFDARFCPKTKRFSEKAGRARRRGAFEAIERAEAAGKISASGAKSRLHRTQNEL
jgi:hypothetical protein